MDTSEASHKKTLQSISSNERSTNSTLVSLNEKHLSNKENKELKKNQLEKSREIKKQLVIRNHKKSHSFIKWLLSNNEK